MKDETALLTPLMTPNLKCIKDLNVRFATIKLLEGNIAGKLLDTGLGSSSLARTPKAHTKKQKSVSGATTN